MAQFNKMQRAEIEAIRNGPQPPGFTGVEQSDETMQWLWENFSAAGGDHPSFECWRA